MYLYKQINISQHIALIINLEGLVKQNKHMHEQFRHVPKIIVAG